MVVGVDLRGGDITADVSVESDVIAMFSRVVSEHGRIGVSGPEVIETNMGVEEFDARDRALIWRTMGGKHRYLIGGADVFVDDSASAFREAAIAALHAKPRRGG